MKSKILLVDDDPIASFGVKLLLEDSGYEVTLSTTVKDALAKLDGQQYQLCITDLSMSHDSGIDLLKSLRSKNSKNETLPVIVMSGFAQMMQKEVMPYRPSYIFSKLVDINQLIWAVNDSIIYR